MNWHLTKNEVNKYRDYFINGIMDVHFIRKEMKYSDRTLYNVIYNKKYKDKDYQLKLDCVKKGSKIPFTLPICQSYTNAVRRVLSDYNIPIEQRSDCLKENMCSLTYDDQTAMYINDENENKYLLIIENVVSRNSGYLVPYGKYKIQLNVEENRQYFSKFIYSKEDSLRIKEIKNHKDYWVSENGVVISLVNGKILTNRLTDKGYHSVTIKHNKISNNYSIHRLVADAFISNPDNKPQVNHIDGIKTNNHHTNLEWCNNSENQRHAIRIGLKKIKYGKDTPTSKFTNQQVREIRELFATGKYTIAQLAREFNVSDTTITYILTYKSYKDATDINKLPAYIMTNKNKLNGQNAPRSKFTNQQVREIRELFATGKYTIADLTKKYNTFDVNIRYILQYKSYKDATDINKLPAYIPQLKQNVKGENSCQSKFTNQQVREIRELFATGKYTIAQLAREFNVAYSSMYSILTYETYKN